MTYDPFRTVDELKTPPAYRADVDAERDADDAAYCAAYVDAVHLGASSAVDYLRGMAADYDDHAHELAAQRITGGDHTRAIVAARAKADAYRDALRVLDIAADSAQRIADRARDDRRAALTLGAAR